MSSNVSASWVMQVPFRSSKHPAERAIPLLKDEVALLVRRMFPPVIVRPEPVVNPPIPATSIPPAKVLVAVEEALRAWIWRSPETESLSSKVEEAWERTPPTN